MPADRSPRRVSRRVLLAGVALAGTGLLVASTGALRAGGAVPLPKKPARIGVLWSVGAYAPTFTEKELAPELERLGQLAGRDYVWEIRKAEGRP